MIYCDFNSSTPLSENLRGVFFELPFANPSSQNRLGKLALKHIHQVEDYLHLLFNLNQDYKTLFHSGATEGCNIFIKGCLDAGDIFYYFDLDHAAILKQIPVLEAFGIECIKLPINKSLNFNTDEILNILRSNSSKNSLLNFTWVHNETGRCWELDLIKQMKSIAPHLIVHVDATQTIGKIDQFKELDHGDIFTYSGHKFGALKGIGWSFYKSNIQSKALTHGGGQQKSLRPGTLNTQGIVSLKYALEELEEKKSNDIKSIFKQFRSHLKELDLIIDFGEFQNCAQNTCFLVFKSLQTQVILAALDIEGIYAGAGAACSSGVFQESQLMKSIGLADYAKNTLRISVDPYAAAGDLKSCLEKITKIIKRIS